MSMHNYDRTVKARTFVSIDPHKANNAGSDYTNSPVEPTASAMDSKDSRNVPATSPYYSNFENEKDRSNIMNDHQQQQQQQQQQHEWPVDAASYRLLGKVGRGASATVYKAQTMPLVSSSFSDGTNNEDNGNHNTGDNHNANNEEEEEEEEKVEEEDTDMSVGRLNHVQPASNTAKGLVTQRKYCAIKVINLEHVDTNFMDIRQEVQTMRLSQNENILSCYTSFIHHTNLWLVMQLMDKGSSLHCIQQAKLVYTPAAGHIGNCTPKSMLHPKSMLKPTNTTIDLEYHITYILHETILGLQYIHSHGQIHRDIKASNILLDSNASVRIADFGVSGWLINAGSKRENTRTFVGTPCWMAPEVMEQIHGYDTKADIWSLGITALELAKGYAPYAKYPPMKVLLMTIQDDPPGFESYPPADDWDDDHGQDGMEHNDEYHSVTDKELLTKQSLGGYFTGRQVGKPTANVPTCWSQSFQTMVNWCLQKDPSKRPNCEQLLNHEHFKIFLKDETLIKAYKEKFKEEICDWIPDAGNEMITTTQSNGILGDVRMDNGVERAMGSVVKEQQQQQQQQKQAQQQQPQTNNNHESSLPICTVASIQDDNHSNNNKKKNSNTSSGTTWIFNDGSQVTVKSHVTAELDHGENHSSSLISGKIIEDTGGDCDYQDFFDQFESATQGENFKHPSTIMDHETSNIDSSSTKDKGEGIDSSSQKIATTDDLNAFMDQFEMETSGENFLNRV